MQKTTSPISRRSVLVGAAAASAAVGAPLPASAGISPRLVKLLQQRERLDAEIARLAAPARKLMPRVPELLRIDPAEATFEFLSSGCESFHTMNVHGEACLWGTSAWWCDDEERDNAAATYFDACTPAWEALGQTASGDDMENHIFDLGRDLGKLEGEILRNEPASTAELRLLAQVACEQYLGGRAVSFPLRLIRGVLSLV